MNFRFIQVRLLVKEYQACFRFYRDVLGFEPNWGDEHSGYADFKTGDVMIGLFGRKHMAEAVGNAGKPFDAEGQDRVALVFSVPDVDAEFRALEAKGVDIVSMPVDRKDWGVRTAHFRDPDGNLIEIHTPLKL